MSNATDPYNHFLVVDGIEDTVITYSDAPDILVSFELFATGWPRILRKRDDFLLDSHE
jgi:hypothetical protein